MNAPDLKQQYIKSRGELHDLIEEFGMATFHLREAISFEHSPATDSARDALEIIEGMVSALNEIAVEIAKTLPDEDQD